MKDFKWELIPNRSWSCERYCCGAIKFGWYNHTMDRANDDGNYPNGEYIGTLVLPSIKKQYVYGTKEEVKQRIEDIVKSWFAYINNQ
jgi:hypothetical protein